MKIRASYHQERLWFIDKFETGSIYEQNPVYYNIPIILQLTGKINREKLEKSILEVIKRHEALRTRIITSENEPLQEILEHVGFKLEVDDLTETSGEDKNKDNDKDKQAMAITAAINYARQPFRLDAVPLIRGRLIQFEEDAFILVLVVHHIISDRYSLNIIVDEILSCYRIFLTGNRLEFQGPGAHYADFSQWQRGFSDEILEPLLFYWKKKLKGTLQPLEIPTDRPRSPQHTYQDAWQSFTLPANPGNKIKDFARQEGFECFTLLLAAFKTLLFRYTDQEEIVVGTGVDNRNHPGMQRIVGPISNLLVLRTFVNQGAALIHLASQLQQTIEDARKHQAMPFDLLVSELKPDVDVSRNALFDVLFQYEDTSTQLPTLENLEVNRIETNLGWGKYDLNLLMRRQGNIFSGVIVYNMNYFNSATITRLIRHYEILLARIPEEPYRDLCEFSLLSPQERQQLLSQWNRPPEDYPGSKTIRALFEEQAEKNPDNIAFIAVEPGGWETGEDGEPGTGFVFSVSYKELNNRADRLAHTLKEKSIQPETIVGIMMKRSPAMVIGIMGILKANAAYLPIDPAYPRDRIDYMLTDSSARLVVTASTIEKEVEKLRSLEDKSGHETIFLDSIDFSTPSSSHLLNFSTSPSSLAYVLYTSGSTGKPKGVAIEQASVVNILYALYEEYPFEKRDTYLFKTSYLFDVSVSELFGYFSGGGRLAILENGAEKDAQRIIAAIEILQVTHINFVPSMFSAFVEVLGAYLPVKGRNLPAYHGLPGLKYIFLAGEALSPVIVGKFRQLDPNGEIRLENIYGPTEGTIYAARYPLSAWPGGDNIPIGKPMQNVILYILNKYGDFQPVGLPGELCIAGKGLARGYLNNPQLTGEKFVNIARVLKETTGLFSLYRTGDLARWLPGGNIEFLGRMDHQVKIRGFRVELGEIESRLLKHKDIKESVVTAGTAENNDNFLCAYIVFKPGRTLAVSELREYLLESLPEYMIPQYFVFLNSIPLTANGKTDRNALPSPQQITGRENIAPRDAIERELAGLWGEVLGLEKSGIGIDMNFFRLGGHSLKATILAARIHKTFDVRLSLAKLFKLPTIRALSQYIKNSARNRYVSIKPVEKKEYYPLSYAQKRIYTALQLEPGSTSYNMATILRLIGELDREHLQDTFRKLLQTHESLRTSFEIIGNEPVQKVHDTVEFSVEYCGFGEDASILRRYIRAFDISRAPLLRVYLLKVADGEHALMFDISHLAVDGLSCRMLEGDLMSLYNKKELPALNLQYKDFSAWEHRLFYTGEIKKQEDFWLNQFKGHLPELELAADFPRPDVRSVEAGDIISVALEGDLKPNISDITGETGSTLFTFLLAVYYVLLNKYSGQEDIVVGTVVTGRSHGDLQRVIGVFINMLALRNRPQPGKRFKDFLEEVKENSFNAFEKQDYPLEELVRKLEIKGKPGRHPLFDTEFAVNNIDREKKVMPGLRMERYASGINFAKFDLHFLAVEYNDYINIVLRYSTELFKTASAEKILRHFVEITEIVVENPGIKLEDIEITMDLMSIKSNSLEKEQGDFNF